MTSQCIPCQSVLTFQLSKCISYAKYELVRNCREPYVSHKRLRNQFFFQKGAGGDNGDNQLLCESLKRKEGTELTGEEQKHVVLAALVDLLLSTPQSLFSSQATLPHLFLNILSMSSLLLMPHPHQRKYFPQCFPPTRIFIPLFNKCPSTSVVQTQQQTPDPNEAQFFS